MTGETKRQLAKQAIDNIKHDLQAVQDSTAILAQDNYNLLVACEAAVTHLSHAGSRDYVVMAIRVLHAAIGDVAVNRDKHDNTGNVRVFCSKCGHKLSE